MRSHWYPMMFDPETDRWVVKIRGNTYGLHCGDCFEIRIGDQGVPARLELGRSWFVEMQKIRFDLRLQDIYQIRLD